MTGDAAAYGLDPAQARDADLRRADVVPFLLFDLEGHLYGVNANQGEALIEGDAAAGIFYQGQELAVQPLAAWVGLDAPRRALPRVLVNRSEEGVRGFLVEMPLNILGLAVEDIFALPALIRRVLGPSPLWGVGRTSQGLLLLVDLEKVGSDEID